ncbi:hypothetical protein AAW14_24765 [Streptomyces hygroscopicus]|nr:hypothetical protein [Streptomyces hygroscopicus]
MDDLPSVETTISGCLVAKAHGAVDHVSLPELRERLSWPASWARCTVLNRVEPAGDGGLGVMAVMACAGPLLCIGAARPSLCAAATCRSA